MNKEHTTHESHAKSVVKTNESMKMIVLSLLVINLILSVYVAFFKKDALWLESMKAGGSKNFGLVQQLYQNDTYKTQQAQTLNQIMNSMQANPSQAGADTTANQQTDTAAADTTQAQTLDKAKISEILKGAPVQGSANAKIVLIEYSDLICPFCKRHYESQTLEKVVAKYPKDVALVFKNMPLVQLHPTAFKGAEGMACANKLWGSEKAFAYLAEGFKAEEFTDDNVISIGKTIGLGSADFANCVKNGETQTEINATIQEGQSLFGINGTPGNVILNKETGKYVVIAGAYPFEKFDEEVAKLLK